MAQHARLKIDAGMQVYFCDAHSPWQRGTNENTNELLRQYFPKGTDLSVHSADEVAAMTAALNSRPCQATATEPPRCLRIGLIVASYVPVRAYDPDCIPW
jgi:IS30 family transposase